jgi:hypothetical protein
VCSVELTLQRAWPGEGAAAHLGGPGERGRARPQGQGPKCSEIHRVGSSLHTGQPRGTAAKHSEWSREVIRLLMCSCRGQSCFNWDNSEQRTKCVSLCHCDQNTQQEGLKGGRVCCGSHFRGSAHGHWAPWARAEHHGSRRGEAGGEKPEVLMEDRKQRQGNEATIPH